jgi:hypothetical protein
VLINVCSDQTTREVVSFQPLESVPVEIPHAYVSLVLFIKQVQKRAVEVYLSCIETELIAIIVPSGPGHRLDLL